MSKLLNSNLLKKDGFTLLEMVISIGIFVLVATAAAVVSNQAILAYYTSTAKAFAVREATLAMDWIRQDIRHAVDDLGILPKDLFIDAPPIYTDANQILINNGPIRYHRVGDTIKREEAGADVLLAQNVTKLAFNYFNNETQSLATPVNDPYLRTVEITIVVSKNNQEFCLYSAERLIN